MLLNYTLLVESSAVFGEIGLHVLLLCHHGQSTAEIYRSATTPKRSSYRSSVRQNGARSRRHGLATEAECFGVEPACAKIGQLLLEGDVRAIDVFSISKAHIC